MINPISGSGYGAMAMQGARSRPAPEEIFNEIDADGSGSVDATEIQTMADHLAERMGEDAPTAEDLMAKLDSDGDGAMSFAEFEAGRPQGPPPGGGKGMMPPGLQFDTSGQMDLNALFGTDEEEDAAAYEAATLYA